MSEEASPKQALIRRARPGDAHAVSALIARYVVTGHLLPRTPAFVAEHSLEFVVAVLDGRVIGCAHLEEYSPSLAELRSLTVEPRQQGRGVGVALVQAVEQLAILRGYAVLFAVSNNEPFFLHRGFELRDIPELDRERSEVSKFKGVFAKDLSLKTVSLGPRPDED